MNSDTKIAVDSLPIGLLLTYQKGINSAEQVNKILT